MFDNLRGYDNLRGLVEMYHRLDHDVRRVPVIIKLVSDMRNSSGYYANMGIDRDALEGFFEDMVYGALEYLRHDMMDSYVRLRDSQQDLTEGEAFLQAMNPLFKLFDSVGRLKVTTRFYEGIEQYFQHRFGINDR